MADEAVKFSAKRFILAPLFEAAAWVAPKGQDEVVSSFRVRVTPESLAVAATDMALAVEATTQVVAADAEATVLLPVRKTMAILAEAEEGDVTVSVAGGVATIAAGLATWKLQLRSPRDYPALPDASGVPVTEVSREKLLAALLTVRRAASRDGNRPSFMSISVRGGKFTACDSARLQQASLAGFPDMQIPVGAGGQAVDGLVRMLKDSAAGTVGAGQTESHLVFRVGVCTYLAAKFAVATPDFEKMLLTPALANDQAWKVDRQELEEAVRRVRISSDATTSAIGLRLASGAAGVFSQDTGGNYAEEVVSCSWAGADGRLVVVSHVYLLQALEAHGTGPCEFRLGPDRRGRRSPLLLCNEETGVTGVVQQMSPKLVGY